MGGKDSKQPKPLSDKECDMYSNKLTQVLIEIEANITLQLSMNNSKFQQAEQELVRLINGQNRNAKDEIHKAELAVEIRKKIKGLNIIGSKICMLKPNISLILKNVHQPNTFQSLFGIIVTLMYATQKLEIPALQKFNNIILGDLKLTGIDYANTALISPDFLQLFDHILAQPNEVNEYIVNLAKCNGWPLTFLNQAGHHFNDDFVQSNGQPFINPNATNPNNFNINPNNIPNQNPQIQPFGQFVPQQQQQGNYLNQSIQDNIDQLKKGTGLK